MSLKILGSIAIVAGTAIGAGMLALPLATAALGFWQATVLMLVIWALATYTSLLMLEINLKSGVGDNLFVITGKLLGKKGQFIQSASFTCLLFALTAAYLTGGSSLLSLKAQTLLNIELSHTAAVLLFTGILGGFAAMGVAWVDKVSRLLFSLMVVALALVLLFLLPEVSPAQVMTQAVTDNPGNAWLAAIPVVFTSFGFHVCIATLVRYLDGDAKALRKVLLIGSTIPLACYILWLLVTLGTLGGPAIHGLEGSLPKLVTALQAIVASDIISKAVSLFADLALITSFLGVTLSLYDFLAELTRTANTFIGRLQTWLITFIPPLLCALFYPDGFIAVLGFAAVPLVFIIVFLPIAMALRQRYSHSSGYQVAGGKVGFMLAASSGLAIVFAQLWVAL
ncbi:amino acid permease [Shewanella submarina]|uniref:Amino acid permease n=1 Tax=Shewanella submarina TaxID=2016376 RepID=A0ABV7GM67_9GAMM|nr:amino acid permease [Shewanella submarina]